MVVVANPPADLCASPLAPWLASALAPATCGAHDVAITYRRVGVGGHDLVAVLVVDSHETGYDGPVHRSALRVVDGVASPGWWAESDLDAYALPIPSGDEEARALLLLAGWSAEPAPMIDSTDVEALAQREPGLAAALRSRPVGLARAASAITLTAWNVVFPEGVHRAHPTPTPGHLDYVAVRMEEGRIRSTSERVLVGELHGAEARWRPAPPTD